jgi:uncharacterized protein
MPPSRILSRNEMKLGDRKFEGKRVLITGASHGIGKQTAFEFARHGADVIILVARTRSKLIELESLLQGSEESRRVEVVSYQCDVSNMDEVDNLAGLVIRKFGYIDILINNAGVGIYGKVKDQTLGEIEIVMRTNYLGTIYCTKAFLESMLNRHSGHIVNVASVAASFGVAGMAGYCASKYAVLGFSESLYHELHGTGVGITVVSPIGVKTQFFDHESFGSRKPVYTGFFLEPKTVSKAILRASCSRRLEIIVPFYIRAGVWLKQTFPFFINPLVGKLFRYQLNRSERSVKDQV